MKKLYFILLSITCLFVVGGFVSAAPAPTLFAYNDNTKECGSFRDGDEYVRYDLPSAWQTYDYDKSTAKTTQQYCDDLGYTNIGLVVSYLDLTPITIMERPDSLTTDTNASHTKYTILAAGAVVFIGLVVIVLIKSKKTTPDNS